MALTYEEKKRLEAMDRRLEQIDDHLESTDKDVASLLELKESVIKMISILKGIGIAIIVALFLLGAISIDQLAKWLK